jgi:hypothetical protein
LILFDSYAEALTSQLPPWKETQPCNVTPMAVAGVVGAKYRGCAAKARPGRVGKGSMVVGGLVLGVGGPLEATGARCTDSRRWRPPLTELGCGWTSPGLVRDATR